MHFAPPLSPPKHQHFCEGELSLTDGVSFRSPPRHATSTFATSTPAQLPLFMSRHAPLSPGTASNDRERSPTRPSSRDFEGKGRPRASGTLRLSRPKQDQRRVRYTSVAPAVTGGVSSDDSSGQGNETVAMDSMRPEAVVAPPENIGHCNNSDAHSDGGNNSQRLSRDSESESCSQELSQVFLRPSEAVAVAGFSGKTSADDDDEVVAGVTRSPADAVPSLDSQLSLDLSASLPLSPQLPRCDVPLSARHRHQDQSRETEPSTSIASETVCEAGILARSDHFEDGANVFIATPPTAEVPSIPEDEDCFDINHDKHRDDEACDPPSSGSLPACLVPEPPEDDMPSGGWLSRQDSGQRKEKSSGRRLSRRSSGLPSRPMQTDLVAFDGSSQRRATKQLTLSQHFFQPTTHGNQEPFEDNHQVVEDDRRQSQTRTEPVLVPETPVNQAARRRSPFEWKVASPPCAVPGEEAADLFRSASPSCDGLRERPLLLAQRDGPCARTPEKCGGLAGSCHEGDPRRVTADVIDMVDEDLTRLPSQSMAGEGEAVGREMTDHDATCLPDKEDELLSADQTDEIRSPVNTRLVSSKLHKSPDKVSCTGL